MGSLAVHYSSLSDEWATPSKLFDRLSAKYGPFNLDVCATAENAKCERYFSREQDGLKQEWQGRCWMNPPYGRGIGAWVKKAFSAAEDGALVVCLLPARTDTLWWHRWVMLGDIEFLKGRVSFERQGKVCDPAPFPSAVVVFRPGITDSLSGQQKWALEGSR